MPPHTNHEHVQAKTTPSEFDLAQSSRAQYDTDGDTAQAREISLAKGAQFRRLRFVNAISPLLYATHLNEVEIESASVNDTGEIESASVNDTGEIERALYEKHETMHALDVASLESNSNVSSPIGILRNPYQWLLANRYLLNNMLLLGTNVLAGIFAYLLHPFLGHVLGIQQYGQVAALIALTTVLTTPTQIISTVAAKYASSLSASEDYAQLNDFIRRLTVIFLVTGVVTTAVFIMFSGYIAAFLNLDSSQGVIILGFIFLIEFVTPLNLGAIQGLERFGWYSTMTFLTAFLRLTFAVGFVLLGLGVNGVILGVVVSAILTYLLSFQPLVKVLKGPRLPTGSLRSLWSYSVLALVAAGGIVALSTIDTVLARHFLSDHEAGLYAALATIGKIVLFVTSSVSMVLFPKVVALQKNGESHVREAGQAILGVLLLSVAAEVPCLLVPALITKLMFGPAFAAIAVQLAPYGLAMLLLALGQVLMTYFLACGNRSFVIMILAACILQVGLIFWHHADIAQLVNAVITTNAALVLTLLAIFGLRIYLGKN